MPSDCLGFDPTFDSRVSLMAQMVKNPQAMLKTWVQSLRWEDSLGGWQGNSLQCYCLQNPHAQRSLVGYNQWGHKELDTGVDSLWPCRLHHARPPSPSPTPGAYSNSCPLSWRCHPTISSSVIPFSSCSQSLPALGSCQWVSSSRQVAKLLEFQL